MLMNEPIAMSNVLKHHEALKLQNMQKEGIFKFKTQYVKERMREPKTLLSSCPVNSFVRKTWV